MTLQPRRGHPVNRPMSVDIPSEAKLDPSLGAQGTAAILVERYGAKAFDFAAQQAAIMKLAGAKSGVERWRNIARAVEDLLSRASG
jgi:hypothetical protein